MRPFTRRTVSSLAAALAFGIAALAAASAAPGSAPYDVGSASAGTPATATTCDPDGVATSFGLDPTSPGVVDRIVVTDIAPACVGQEVTVVVAGVVGRAVAASPRTEVLLERGVPAADVTALTVEITPVATRAERA